MSTPEERIAELETQNSQLRTATLRHALTDALLDAKCRPEGLSDMVTMLLATSQAEFNADGRVASLSIGGESYESAQAAAEAFMASRPYMLAPETRDGLIRSGERIGPRPEALVAESLARSSTPAAPASRAKQEPAERISLDALIDSGQSPGELATQGWLEQPAK